MNAAPTPATTPGAADPLNAQFRPDELDVSTDGHVGVIELRRPPLNFFDLGLLTGIADAVETLEQQGCRALVLCAQGSAFCAGADFGGAARKDRAQPAPTGLNPVYAQALRLFGNQRPIIAAVHGPAIGGGLGLALAADFRVTCEAARFSANFAQLGIHPGFGLSVTLPRLVGEQAAAELFYTGRRIDGKEAVTLGLADALVDADQVRAFALQRAHTIAAAAPLAIASLRETLRQGLLAQLRHAMLRESEEQYRQFATQDFREGVTAMTERRAPVFVGR